MKDRVEKPDLDPYLELMTKKPEENFSHSATILPVVDVSASVDFYVHLLGFKLNFSWEYPMSYAVLKRGDVSIHLTARQDDLKPSSMHTVLFIFVHDVDLIYEQLSNSAVDISNPIGTREYGMRDFDITDPDGHVITFGTGQ